jgi:FAD/FMN-containing dehydrogenase
MQPEVIASLSANIHGRVIDPESSEYEVARKVYNGMINRRPAAIVYCSNVVDVTAAINFARQEKFKVAIRGGGHNGAGFGVCDDGLVLDLSAMNRVAVDPASSTVRAGPALVNAPLPDRRSRPSCRTNGDGLEL